MVATYGPFGETPEQRRRRLARTAPPPLVPMPTIPSPFDDFNVGQVGGISAFASRGEEPGSGSGGIVPPISVAPTVPVPSPGGRDSQEPIGSRPGGGGVNDPREWQEAPTGPRPLPPGTVVRSPGPVAAPPPQPLPLPPVSSAPVYRPPSNDSSVGGPAVVGWDGNTPSNTGGFDPESRRSAAWDLVNNFRPPSPAAFDQIDRPGFEAGYRSPGLANYPDRGQPPLSQAEEIIQSALNQEQRAARARAMPQALGMYRAQQRLDEMQGRSPEEIAASASVYGAGNELVNDARAQLERRDPQRRERTPLETDPGFAVDPLDWRQLAKTWSDQGKALRNSPNPLDQRKADEFNVLAMQAANQARETGQTAGVFTQENAARLNQLGLAFNQFVQFGIPDAAAKLMIGSGLASSDYFVNLAKQAGATGNSTPEELARAAAAGTGWALGLIGMPINAAQSVWQQDWSKAQLPTIEQLMADPAGALKGANSLLARVANDPYFGEVVGVNPATDQPWTRADLLAAGVAIPLALKGGWGRAVLASGQAVPLALKIAAATDVAVDTIGIVGALPYAAPLIQSALTDQSKPMDKRIAEGLMGVAALAAGTAIAAPYVKQGGAALARTETGQALLARAEEVGNSIKADVRDMGVLDTASRFATERLTGAPMTADVALGQAGRLIADPIVSAARGVESALTGTAGRFSEAGSPVGYPFTRGAPDEVRAEARRAKDTPPINMADDLPESLPFVEKPTLADFQRYADVQEQYRARIRALEQAANEVEARGQRAGERRLDNLGRAGKKSGNLIHGNDAVNMSPKLREQAISAEREARVLRQQADELSERAGRLRQGHEVEHSDYSTYIRQGQPLPPERLAAYERAAPTPRPEPSAPGGVSASDATPHPSIAPDAPTSTERRYFVRPRRGGRPGYEVAHTNGRVYGTYQREATAQAKAAEYNTKAAWTPDYFHTPRPAGKAEALAGSASDAPTAAFTVRPRSDGKPGYQVVNPEGKTRTFKTEAEAQAWAAKKNGTVPAGGKVEPTVSAEPAPAPRQAAPTLEEAPTPVEPAPTAGRTGAPPPVDVPPTIRAGIDSVEQGNVPTMFTNALRDFLRRNGVADEAMGRLTPTEAWQEARRLAGAGGDVAGAAERYGTMPRTEPAPTPDVGGRLTAMPRVERPAAEPKPSDSLQALRQSDVATAVKQAEAVTDTGGQLTALPKAKVDHGSPTANGLAAIAEAVAAPPKKARAPKVKAGAGAPPKEPPKATAGSGEGSGKGAPRDYVGDSVRMFDEADAAAKPPREGWRKLAHRLYTDYQKAFTGRYVEAHQSQARAQKALDGPLPMSQRVDIQIAKYWGRGESAQRALRPLSEAFDRFEKIKLASGRTLADLADAIWKFKQDEAIFARKEARAFARGNLRRDDVPKAVEQALTEAGEHRGKLEDFLGEVKTYMRDQRAEDVKAGLYPQDVADNLNEWYPYYTPNKVVDYVYSTPGLSKGEFSVTASGLKSLRDEVDADVLGQLQFRPSRAISEYAVPHEVLRARNRVARALGENALEDPELRPYVTKISGVKKVADVDGEPVYRRPSGRTAGTLEYMEDGKRVTLQLAPEARWLEKLPTTLADQSIGPILSGIRFVVKGVLEEAAVRRNPAFIFTRLFQADMPTAFFREGVSPWRSFVHASEAYWDIVGRRESPLLRQMQREGVGMGFYGKEAQDLVRPLRREKRGIAVRSAAQAWDIINNWVLLGHVKKVGESLEAGTRMAAFEKVLSETKLPEEAMLAARRVTVDFNEGGNFVKAANNLFSFLNAGVQGALILPRSLRDSPASRWRLAIMTVTAANVYAWNAQYPEYWDVDEKTRDTHLLFFLPGTFAKREGTKFGDRVVPPSKGPRGEELTDRPYLKIPLRELALIKAPLEWALDKLFTGGRDPRSFSSVLGALSRTSTPVGVDLTLLAQGEFGKFARDASAEFSPPLISTLTQMGMNRDTYRNRPIESLDLQGKPEGERYDERTGAFAKWAGATFGVSPKKLEFFTGSYLAGMGRLYESLLDAATAQMTGTENPPSRGVTGVRPIDLFLSGLLTNAGGQMSENERRKTSEDLGAANQLPPGFVREQRAGAGEGIGFAIEQVEAKQKTIDAALEAARASGDPAKLAQAYKDWKKATYENKELIGATMKAAPIFKPGSGYTPTDKLTTAMAVAKVRGEDLTDDDRVRQVAAVYGTLYDESKSAAENKRTRQTFLAELQSNDPKGYQGLMEQLRTRGSTEEQRFFKAQEAALRAESLKAQDLAAALEDSSLTVTELDRLAQIRSKYNGLSDPQKRYVQENADPDAPSGSDGWRYYQILEAIQKHDQVQQAQAQYGLPSHDQYLATDEAGKDAVLWNLAKPSRLVRDEKKAEEQQQDAVPPTPGALDVTPGQKPVASVEPSTMGSEEMVQSGSPIFARQALSAGGEEKLEMGSEEMYGDANQGRPDADALFSSLPPASSEAPAATPSEPEPAPAPESAPEPGVAPTVLKGAPENLKPPTPNQVKDWTADYDGYAAQALETEADSVRRKLKTEAQQRLNPKMPTPNELKLWQKLQWLEQQASGRDYSLSTEAAAKKLQEYQSQLNNLNDSGVPDRSGLKESLQARIARLEGRVSAQAGEIQKPSTTDKTLAEYETAVKSAETALAQAQVDANGGISPAVLKANERLKAAIAARDKRRDSEQGATGQPDGAYFNEDTGRWEDQHGKALPDSDSRQQAAKQQRQQLLGNLPVTPTQASIAMAEALGTNTPAGQQLLKDVRAGKPDASWKAEPLKPDADRTQKAAVAESFGRAVAAIEEKYLPHLPSSVDARKKRAADVLKQYVQTGEYAAGDLGKEGETKAIKGVKSPPALKEYSDARSMATTAFNFARNAPYTYGDDDANEVQRQGTYVERVLKQHGVDVSIRPEVAFEQLSRTDDPKPSDVVYVRDANGRVTFTGVYLGNGQVGTVGADGKGRLTGVPQGAEFRYVAQPHQGTPFTDHYPGYKRPTTDELQQPSKAPAWAKGQATQIPGGPTLHPVKSEEAQIALGQPHPDVDTFGSFGGGSPDRQEAQKDKLLAHWRAGGQSPAGGNSGGLVGANGGKSTVLAHKELIDRVARESGVPANVIAAIMDLESSGRMDAQGPSTQWGRAQGAMQVMPFHFKEGENPLDPYTNVSRGASILAQNFKKYGDWNKAAAAYFGAIDAQGNVTGAKDATGTDGGGYVKIFNDRLKNYGEGVAAPTGEGTPAAPIARVGQGDRANYATDADWQKWKDDACSPATILAVLRGRGQNLTLSDVAAEMERNGLLRDGEGLTQRDGGMAKAGALFGLDIAKADNAEQALRNATPQNPVMISINDLRPGMGGGHWLNVVGADEKGLFVVDSSRWDNANTGIQRLTWEEYRKSAKNYDPNAWVVRGGSAVAASDPTRDPTQGAIRDPRDVGGKPSVNPYVPGQAGFEGNDPAGARMRPGPLPGAPGSGSPGAAPAPTGGTGTGGGAPAYPGGPIRGTDPPGVLPPRPTDPGQTPDSGSGSRASGGGRQRGGDSSPVPRFRPPQPFELKDERSTSAAFLESLLRGGGQTPQIEPFKVDPYRPPMGAIPAIPAPPPLRYQGGDYGVPAPPPMDPEALLRAHQAKLAPLLRRR